MEFDTNNTGPANQPDISEQDRLSAATKRVTLAPLHADVAPEQPTTDTQGDTTGHGILEAPMGNIPSDSESTYVAPVAAPTTTTPGLDPLRQAAATATKRKHTKLIVGVCGGIVLLTIAIVYFFAR